MLHNALLPGHLCLVPGFPGHNALICSTISLLKVGHFNLQIPKWCSNILDQVRSPCTFCSFVSKKNFPPLIAWSLKKLDQLQVPLACLQQVGLRSIMRKYYYMDTLWAYVLNSPPHSQTFQTDTTHTLSQYEHTLVQPCLNLAQPLHR